MSISSIYTFCRVIKFFNSTLKRSRETTTKKFQRHYDLASDNPIVSVAASKHVINLSKRSLSQVEKEALCRGLDFCVPPKKIDRLRIYGEFESLFQQLMDGQLDQTCGDRISQFKANLVGLAHSICRTKPDTGLQSPEHIEALDKIKKDNSIIVIRPDKGKGVVILDREVYIEKMMSIINDKRKFMVESEAGDIIQKWESKVGKQISDLQQQKKISSELANVMKPTGSTTPRIYGLPKIHKTNIPLRPVLSMVGSPVHRLSKWVADLLKPVEYELCKFNAKDSFTFAKDIQAINIGDVKMASLDVVSLFTNVPLSYTIGIIIRTVKERKIPLPISLDELENLIRLCVENVPFLFNGSMFRQVDGLWEVHSAVS